MSLDDEKIVIDVKKLEKYYSKLVKRHNKELELHKADGKGSLWNGINVSVISELLKFLKFLHEEGDRI